MAKKSERNITEKNIAIPSLTEIQRERKRIRRGAYYRQALRGTVSVLVVVAAVAVLIATLFLPILQISGDSMSPTLEHDEIVILVKTKDFDQGDLIGFYYQGKILLKRIIALPEDEVAIDGDYKYQDRRANLFGSCIVESGMYSGAFSVENGSSRMFTPEIMPVASSDEEAARFAKNLLRHANKGCYGGFVRSVILPGYAPASTVDLSNARAPSWDGRVFIEHIRNDYGRGESKVFFRKPLEGY